MSWDYRGINYDINWRNEEWMTEIIDQGNTNACWALAVCDLVEMLHNRQNRHKPLHSRLAAQELIDNYKYSSEEEAMEKKGSGQVGWAFEYIKKNGIAYEDDYPWIGVTPSFEKKERREYQNIYRGVSGFEKIELFKNIEDVVKNHPVIGSFYLTDDFKLCQNSDIQPLYPIVTDYNDVTNQRGHAMVIVGQGEEDFDRYWHVKNTWGIGWGDKGYARLLKSLTTPKRAYYPCYYPLIHEE